MELQGAIELLKMVLEFKIELVTVFVDSQYVQKGITLWVTNWKANDWKTASGQSVKNQDQWKELDKLNSGLLLGKVSWKWVKAHSSTTPLLNKRVDKLANEARIKKQ